MDYIAHDRLLGESENGTSTVRTDAGDTLAPIDLDFVPLNVPLSFPLFLSNGNGLHRRFVLIRNRGTALSLRIREQLRQDEGRIYTKGKFIKAYEESVDTHLEEILTDESVPLEKRLAVLQEKGETVLKEFFARPDSKENCQRTQKLVNNVVRLTLSEDLSVQTMLRLARRDYETYTHSLQVCILGVGFSQRLFTEREIVERYSFSGDLEKVGQGFIYHDLGKSLLTDPKILKKGGPLTSAEWEAVKKHPLDGAQLLEELGFKDRDVLHITLYHHERMDGKGYPYGLNGIEIPSIAKVAAITDAFDAITSRRPYKKAISTFQALAIMRDENAGFYEPELFQRFVQMFGRKHSSSEPQPTEEDS
jgi:HD-GYP domain-containing protein (c-di-GMP phosphodiesterase class II)